VFKAALIIASIIATMVVIKDGRVLREAGLLSSCSALTSLDGEGGYWHACRPGKLEGWPDLRRRSCVSRGVRAGHEYWLCPEHVGSANASD
jgi:hypothetical protein